MFAPEFSIRTSHVRCTVQATATHGELQSVRPSVRSKAPHKAALGPRYKPICRSRAFHASFALFWDTHRPLSSISVLFSAEYIIT